MEGPGNISQQDGVVPSSPKWLAKVSQSNNQKNLSNSSMELVWVPVKIGENGEGEIIGDSGDISRFDIHQLRHHTQILASSSSTESSELGMLDLKNHENAEANRDNNDVDANPIEILVLEPRPSSKKEDNENDENNNELKAVKLSEGVDACGSDAIPQSTSANVSEAVPHPDELQAVEAAIDVGAEVDANDNFENMRPIRHNWRMLLFLLIIFILCYQLIDRYWMNPSSQNV